MFLFKSSNEYYQSHKSLSADIDKKLRQKGHENMECTILRGVDCPFVSDLDQFRAFLSQRPLKNNPTNLSLLQLNIIHTDVTLLKSKIYTAVSKYIDWCKVKSSKGWFKYHGPDGARRANEVKRQAVLATDSDQIWNLLARLAKNEITQDQNGFIGGKVQANPNSFISFLLNELINDTSIMQQIFSPQVIHFTDDPNQMNNIRTNILSNLRSPIQLIVGEYHSHISPKRLLIQNMEKLRCLGIKILFMEHLYYDEQELLDQYFFGKSDVIPQALQKRLDDINYGHGLPNGELMEHWNKNNFTSVVEAAKRAGIRVVALDTRFSYTQQDMDDFGEHGTNRRYVVFHYTAFRIIQAETFNFSPKMPWCALIGSGHVKTIYPNIPGLADMTGAASIVALDYTNDTTQRPYGNLSFPNPGVLDVSVEGTPIKFVKPDLLFYCGIQAPMLQL